MVDDSSGAGPVMAESPGEAPSPAGPLLTPAGLWGWTQGCREGGLSLSPTQFSGRLLSDGRTVTQSGWHWTVTVKRSSCTFLYNRTDCTKQSFSGQISSFQNVNNVFDEDIMRCFVFFFRCIALCYQVSVSIVYVFVWQPGEKIKSWDVATTLIIVSLFRLTHCKLPNEQSGHPINDKLGIRRKKKVW